MSRWDSLKPENPSKGRSINNTRSRTYRCHESGLNTATDERARETTTRLKNSSGKARTAFVKPTQKQQQHNVQHHSLSSTNFQGLYHLYEQFFDSKEQGIKIAAVSKLAASVANSPAVYLSEPIGGNRINVGTLVDSIFLSYLEDYALSALSSVVEPSATKSSLDHEVATTCRTAVSVLVALQHLVNDKSHQTILFAPVLVEIIENGIENQRENGIRLRIFRILQDLLLPFCTTAHFSEPQLAQLRVQVILCLIDCLRVSHVIEGTTKHAFGSQADVDPILLQKFFVSVVNHKSVDRRMLQLSLELLITYVQRQPGSSRQLISSLMLVQDTVFNSETNKISSGDKISSLSHCSCEDMLRFPSAITLSGSRCSVMSYLQVLHGGVILDGSDGRCSLLAAKLGVMLLDNASPIFQQWLKPEPRKSNATFRDRIQHGFLVLLRVSRCCLVRQRRQLQVELPCIGTDIAALSGTLLRRVPFVNDQPLLKAGVLLAQEMVDLIRYLMLSNLNDSSRIALPSSGVAVECTTQVADAMLKAIGGSETPEGVFLEISFPIKSFLNTARGHQALEEMLKSLTAIKDNKLQIILRAISRTHPSPFFSGSSTANLWDLLLEQTFGKTRNHRTARHEGFELLSALFEGRLHRFTCQSHIDEKLLSSSSHVVKDAVPLLKECLRSETPAKIIMVALSCYGFLLAQDWDLIASISSLVVIDHVECILEVCRNAKPSSKLRKVAFKTLGELCTNFFSCDFANDPTHSEENKYLFDTIGNILLTELKHGTISLSMALYAAGNFARISIKMQLSLLQPLVLEQFAVLLLELCDHKSCEQRVAIDSKIESNAVRALSHIVCLMFSDKQSFSTNMKEARSILERVLNTLNAFVRETIRLAKREIGGTWKQRSTIKKTGWGAGHALSSILNMVITQDRKPSEMELLDERCRASVRFCLSTLMDCVTNLSCMNEKVGIVAMSSLCSVDLSCSRFLEPSRADEPVDSLIPPLGPVILQCSQWLFDRDNMTMALSQKTVRQVEILLLHLLSSCSVSDAEYVLHWLVSLVEDEGRRRLRCLTDWLLAQQESQVTNMEAVQRAFVNFSLAMHKRPDFLTAIDDIQLEQQFSYQATQICAATTLSPSLENKSIGCLYDEEEEL